MVPPGCLITDKRNARSHSEKQIGQVARSIERFGFIGPVLIDDGGRIICGHARVEAAKQLGLDHVPTLRVIHLSTAERKAYAIADNRLAELAAWDSAILAVELQSLIELNFDVELTGFQIDDVEFASNEPEKSRPKTRKRDRDELAPALPVSRAGDIWLLGSHQLRCGDTVNKRSNTSIDAALRAWQSAAGEPAVLFETGKTFAEVEKERAASNEAIRKSRAAMREAA
jgi:ParB-like chromosome segregation protein Spo0J